MKSKPFKMKNPLLAKAMKDGSPMQANYGSPMMKVDTDQYKGKTQSSTANYNIGRGKQDKQRAYVEGISEKLGGTKRQKRAQKKIMDKSEKIRKREAKQLEREKRTGKKEGTGLIGKVRKKVIDVTQKRTTKGINRQMDKLTSSQAFNVGRRYVPGKTYTRKGKVYDEKTGSEVKPKVVKDPKPKKKLLERFVVPNTRDKDYRNPYLNGNTPGRRTVPKGKGVTVALPPDGLRKYFEGFKRK